MLQSLTGGQPRLRFAPRLGLFWGLTRVHWIASHALSTLQAAWLITPWPLAVVATAPLAGRMIGRYPSGLLGGVGLAAMAFGLAMLAVLPAHPALADIAWRMALCGAGFGLF